MPLASCFIDWGDATVGRSASLLAQVLKATAEQAGLSVVADMTVSGDPTAGVCSFVAKSEAFPIAGDNLCVWVRVVNSGTAPAVYLYAIKEWVASTKQAVNPIGPYGVGMRITSPMQMYFSASEDFVGVMSKFATGAWSRAMFISRFERLPGDEDPGTFYGGWDSADPLKVKPPVWFDGSATGYFACATQLGGALATLPTTDETGNDAVLDIYVNRASFGKLKGRLLGPRATTSGTSLVAGTVISLGGEYAVVAKNGTATYLLPLSPSFTTYA